MAAQVRVPEGLEAADMLATAGLATWQAAAVAGLPETAALAGLAAQMALTAAVAAADGRLE
jgi:hypothetical protein